MYIITVEATKKISSGTRNTGGDPFVSHSKEVNRMEYQVNVYGLINADRDYTKLNRDLLTDMLVPVPDSLRQIPEEYFLDHE